MGSKGQAPTARAANDAFGLYHRLESPTQTVEDAIRIESSRELWGKAARGSDFPTVKAYDGPLPAGEAGIEFTTPVKPTPGSPPGHVQWYPGTPGVTRDWNDVVKITVFVTKNTQTP